MSGVCVGCGVGIGSGTYARLEGRSGRVWGCRAGYKHRRRCEYISKGYFRVGRQVWIEGTYMSA